MPVRERRPVRRSTPGTQWRPTMRLIATDHEVDAEPAPPPSRPRRAGRREALVLAAVLAVVLGLLGWSALRWWDAGRLERAHQAALAAAKQTTVDFVTISASSVDGDLQRIADGATGDFKDEFTRGLPQVRQAVVENKVESTGQVLRAGLVSGDLDSAVVLVAVDASVRNVGAPDGRLSHYRIQVDLALDPGTGRWLVSRLQFVG